MSVYKRIGSFALVLVLIFMVFASPLTPPAQAANPAIPVVAVAGLLALLGLIGITFATTDAAKEAASMVSAYDDLWEDINSIFTPPEEPPSGIAISAATTAMVVSIFGRLKSLFPAEGEGEFEVIDYENVYYTYNDIPVSANASSLSGLSNEQLFNLAPFTENSQVTMVDISGNQHLWKVVKHSGGWTLYVNESPVVLSGDRETILIKYGFFPVVQNGLTYLIPYWTYSYPYQGQTLFTGSVPSSYYYSSPYNYNGVQISSDTLLEQYPPRIYPYKEDSKYPLRDITGPLIDLVNGTGTITIPITDMVTAIETETDEDIQKDQDYWFDLIPGLKDIIGGPVIPTPDPDGDFDPPRMDGYGLLDKFPFCVPKDLYLLVTALNAPAEAPKWTIPIKFDVIDFYQEYEFDLGRFNTLAVAIRWGLTLIFLAGLIMVSRKMIKG